jgi:uncharacterized protein (DUF2147 family)
VITVFAASAVAAKPNKQPVLTGKWVLSTTITANDHPEIINAPVGTQATATWSFSRKCKQGKCVTSVTRTFSGGTETTTARLRYKGNNTYVWNENYASDGECSGTTIPDGASQENTFTLKVTATKSQSGKLTATAFTANGNLTWTPVSDQFTALGCAQPVPTHYAVEYTATR